MSTEISTSELDEFERIKNAILRSPGMTFVLSNHDAIICLKADSEVLYDLGKGTIKKIRIDETLREDLLKTVEGLTNAIFESYAQKS